MRKTKNIGENICYFRNLRGLTKTELANKIQVDITTIMHYEQNKYSPKNEKLRKIALVLNLEDENILKRPLKIKNKSNRILIRIGNNIRFYRLKMGLNQKELAKKAKLSEAVISEYENNKIKHNPVVLKKIGKALELKDFNILMASNNKKLDKPYLVLEGKEF